MPTRKHPLNGNDVRQQSQDSKADISPIEHESQALDIRIFEIGVDDSEGRMSCLLYSQAFEEVPEYYVS